MRTICLNFIVHQPFRFRKVHFFDIGNDPYFYDDYTNELNIRKIATHSYLPTNNLLLKLIQKHEGKFKVSFSISGIVIDQFLLYAPEVIESFQRLANTGCVEFMAETYSHSLVSLSHKDNFRNQVKAHVDIIEELFGHQPKSFTNTDLIYSNEISATVAEMGFKSIITEGEKNFLQWKSPNYAYCNVINPKLKVLLRNPQLSDDIMLRFSNRSWNQWPLTADKYVHWLNQINHNEEVITLLMNYETFGTYHKKDSGIFKFLESFPKKIFMDSDYTFMTPTEIADHIQPISAIDVSYPQLLTSDKDLSSLLRNELQQEAFDKLYALDKKIEHCSDSRLIQDWLYLQASDHFYFMGNKFFSSKNEHNIKKPYESPYEAFINYMNILNDFTIRLNRFILTQTEKKETQKTILI